MPLRFNRVSFLWAHLLGLVLYVLHKPRRFHPPLPIPTPQLSQSSLRWRVKKDPCCDSSPLEIIPSFIFLNTPSRELCHTYPVPSLQPLRILWLSDPFLCWICMAGKQRCPGKWFSMGQLHPAFCTREAWKVQRNSACWPPYPYL